MSAFIPQLKRREPSFLKMGDKDCKSIQSIKILTFNSNSIVGKLNDIRVLEHTYKPDIIAITETKIDDRFQDNELLGPSFTVIRNDRTWGGGGVLVALKNSSPQVKLVKSSIGPGESVTCTLQAHSNLTFNLIIFYRPPGEHNLNTLTQLLDSDFTHPNILIGDFNLPDITWSDGYGTTKESSHRSSLHKQAIGLFQSLNLKQLINEPTHDKGNTLDLVFIEKCLFDDVLVDCEVLPGVSDHNAIVVDILLQDFVSRNSCTPRLKYNFKKAEFNEISKHFWELNECFEKGSAMSAEEMWSLFKSKTLESLEKNVPTLLAKPKGKPWITRDILRLIRQRNRAFKRCRKHPTRQNIALEISLKKEVKKAIAKAKSDFIKNRVCNELEFGNSKPLFNLINKARGKSNHINKLVNTPNDKVAEKLAEFFSSVYSSDSVEVPFFEPIDQIKVKVPPPVVVERGLAALVGGLDIRKSAGPDNISAYTLKEFAKNVTPFLPCLTKVLNKSIKTGKVPQDWKMAFICPVFKSGQRDEPGNYRPISLTSITSKLLEHIISVSMWQHINENSILTEAQHGFRQNFSTTTQLLHVSHIATKALNENKDYHIVSFDFAKAFDKVPHNLLVHKLRAYCFDEVIVGWVEEWLRGRESVVKVNGQFSSGFEVKSGVPQGSVLGPLLFLLYINDMPYCIQNAECRLYADDTLLCMDIGKGASGALQNNVWALGDWAKRWGMMFNPKKCLHLRLGNNIASFDLTLNEVVIPKAKQMKYLGLTFESNIKWNEHIHNIVKKANKILGMIKRCLGTSSNSKTCMTSFNSVVRPILEYASQVWSPHTQSLTQELSMVQRKAVKWAFKLKKLDSVSDTMSNNGIMSLCDRRKELDLAYLGKVEMGMYDVKLQDYICSQSLHNTRYGTINPHFTVNSFKYSFYNRMREHVKLTHY